MRQDMFDGNPLASHEIRAYKYRMPQWMQTIDRWGVIIATLAICVVLILYWMYDRDMDNTTSFLKEKFGKKADILESNLRVLQAGYNFGDTTETFTTTYKVGKAKMEPGAYRSIMGNQALAYGLIAASQVSGLPMFLGSYPITPASDILHELARHKNFGVRTFQAEDEIAAITTNRA